MNPHFVEILKAFRDEGVEHLVIGAYALAAHGHVRATLDIDIWVRPTEENAGRTWRALKRFRAPLSEMKQGDFAEPLVLRHTPTGQRRAVSGTVTEFTAAPLSSRIASVSRGPPPPAGSQSISIVPKLTPP